jgi:putative transposase
MIRKRNKSTGPNIVEMGYKFRIYPTLDQEEFFAKHFGCTRFLYNHFLNLRSKAWKERKESVSGFECKRMLPGLKKDLPWLKECNSQSLQQSVLELETAFQKFFDKRLPNGYPQFKKKHHGQSFTVPQHFKTRISSRGNFLLNIPKLKSDIKVQAHREIPGQINSLVISKTSSGKYFVSFSCQVDKKDLLGAGTQGQGEIGIDLGLKDTIVTSAGEKIHNPRHLEKSLKKLKRESKRLSHKKKGSNNRNKQRVKLARLHEKITNQRKDFLHKHSSRIVNENQVICLEDLCIKGMIRNKRLSRHIAGAGMSELTRQIQYKGRWRNRQVIQIGRFDPSSKMCSTPGCAYIKSDLNLSEREWICPECGTFHDRDINAAKNILKIGRDYARINACGENNRCSDLKGSVQVGSMKQEPCPVEA